MIRISLLGNVTVHTQAGPVRGEAAQRRRLALLAMLAAPPLRRHSRDLLIGHLWPEHDTDSARHLLSASVHVLRKALAADVILTSGDDVMLRDDAIQVDAAEFRHAINAADFERALELYSGPFLEGFFISGAPAFEQWVDAERQEYAGLYQRALEEAAEQRERRGDLAGAIVLWRRLVTQDPYSARRAIGLMHALARSGNRGAAIQHARVHAQLLEQEFETAPDADVEALAEMLRTQPSTPSVQASETAEALPTVAAAVGAEPVVAEASTVASARAPVAPTYGPALAQVAPADRPARARLLTSPWKLLGLLVAALLLLSLGTEWRRNVPLTVAVVSFATDSEADHWAEIAEHVVERLAQAERIVVVPSSSTLPLRGQGLDARAVGRRLNTRYVVSISTALNRTGDSLRVRVELVGVRQNDVKWSAAYRFALEEVFRVQDDIAAAVAAAIDNRFTPIGSSDHASASNGGPFTADLDAYDLYLRGVTELGHRSRESLQLAAVHFQRAVERDSMYAQAYARLGETYAMLGSYDYGVLDPGHAYEQARQAATRAHALLAESDMAHAVLGNIHHNYDWDAAAAEREFKLALQRNPRCSPCRQWLGLLYSTQSKHEQAVAQLDTVILIDPASPLAYTNRANVLYYAGRYDAAAGAVERAHTIAPDFGRAHLMHALIDVQRGRQNEAIHRIEGLRERGDEPVLLAVLAHIYGRAGHEERARALVRRLDAVAAERNVPAEYRALAHFGIGEEDRAYDWLRDATARRSNGMLYLAIEPMLAGRRSDPRFAELVQGIGPRR
jgi:DNA-binding SARP family transcriptional activator/TolB-like protein